MGGTKEDLSESYVTPQRIVNHADLSSPASYCGIVGLKPTFGLVPYTGVLSSDSGTDHVGPMASTVLDAAKLLQAIAGYDSIDDRQLGAPDPAHLPRYVDQVLESRQKGIAGLRIGVLREAFQAPALTESVNALVQNAITTLSGLGAVVQEISVPTCAVIWRVTSRADSVVDSS